MHGRRRLLAAVAALAVATLLSGCGDLVGTPAGTDVDLDGSWHLVSARDGGGAFDLVGAPVTLVVEGDEAGGTSACNLYGGRVDVDADAVRVSELGGTEMACEPAVMALERRYLDALGAVAVAARARGRLTLSGPDVVLEFASDRPERDVPLVGTPWLLESLVAGDTVSSVAADGVLRFLDGGRLAGTVGCGRLSGRYALDGDRVVLTTLTDRDPAAEACPPAARAQHAHALDVLRDGFTAEVDGDRLTLTGGDGLGLQLRAG